MLQYVMNHGTYYSLLYQFIRESKNSKAPISVLLFYDLGILYCFHFPNDSLKLGKLF